MKFPHKPNTPLAQAVRATMLSAALSLPAAAFILPSVANAEVSESRQYNIAIPAGSMESVLTELAATTGVTLSFKPEAVKDIMTAGLNGRYRTSAALEMLLTGSGLKAVSQDNGGYSIKVSQLDSHYHTEQETLVADTIIIRGQKISHSLQETKESVAVLTAQDIEQRGLQNLDDVIRQVAGVSASGDTFRLRGIDSGQIGVMRPELASIYVDGVGLSGWVKAEGPQQLWDVSQVEILRGPQSTNLGRNALAGALVINTNDPEYNNSGRFQIGFSELGGRELKAVANANLVDGVSAIRLAVEDSRSDGSVTNITRNEDDYDYDERRNLRLKWLWEPSDDLKLMLSLQDIENSHGNGNVILNGPTSTASDRLATSDQPADFVLDAQLASLAIDYKINDQWQLKSITAGLNGERSRYNDFDSTANNGGQVERFAEDSNLSQELRFNFDNGTTRSSSGLYLSKSKAFNRNNSVINLDLAQQINTFSAGLGDTLVGLGLYPAIYSVNSGGHNEVETENVALFSEWEYDASQDWVLSAGARYNREEQDVELETLGSSSTALPSVPTGFGPMLDGAVATINPILGALATSQPLQSSSTDFDAFIPHIGATYHWNDDVATSFFVKQGYRSGGTEVTQIGSTNAYDPEYLLNYEFALRSQLFDGNGVFNANLYYGKWKDQQVDVPVFSGSNTFTQIENAGESTIYGIEAEFAYRINPALSVYANAAFNHTEYDEFVTNNGDFSGNQFAFAPEVTGAIGAHYNFGNGYALNANATYQGESYADQANNIKLDSHTLINLKGSYQYQDLTAELYVTNLFDEVYITEAFSFEGSSIAQIGAERTVGARVTWDF